MVLSIAFIVIVGAFAASALLSGDPPDRTKVRVVPASAVEWQSLNPLRGDKSPHAGTLWGDRGAAVPCGFLVKFVDGFSSPPHIHPVTYRGVVVSGLVHNDDPKAAEVWLPPGSFWTQPAGEVHITAAKGTTNVAYIEIEKGPYLVHPAEDAFERPEAPIKTDLASMQWTAAPGASDKAGGPQAVALAGNPGNTEIKRWLLKLPAGAKYSISSTASMFHAVVILGRPEHEVTAKSDAQHLEPGSYFGSEWDVSHAITCGAGEECLLYIRTDGDFRVAR